jgi:predicted aconitase
MGAACATIGAVGLFHVENITPEAIDDGRNLLVPDHKTWSIDDQQLEALLASYPIMWEEKDADPEKCFIGCPHLSLDQLHWWTREIRSALQAQGRTELAVRTTVCAAPQVLQAFRSDAEACDKLENSGVKLSAGCPMQLFDNDVSAGEANLTNSNKLRAYTAARFFPDDELVGILVNGEIPGRD